MAGEMVPISKYGPKIAVTLPFPHRGPCREDWGLSLSRTVLWSLEQMALEGCGRPFSSRGKEALSQLPFG